MKIPSRLFWHFTSWILHAGCMVLLSWNVRVLIKLQQVSALQRNQEAGSVAFWGGGGLKHLMNRNFLEADLLFSRIYPEILKFEKNFQSLWMARIVRDRWKMLPNSDHDTISRLHCPRSNSRIQAQLFTKWHILGVPCIWMWPKHTENIQSPLSAEKPGTLDGLSVDSAFVLTLMVFLVLDLRSSYKMENLAPS